jgi:hypothetical protein
VSILVVGEDTPSVPESFQRRLASFDPDLYLVWHKSPHSSKPGRWKIERCTRHLGGFRNGIPVHDHTCVRVPILMVEDEERVPLPLGEYVFTRLREMRANWEALGGNTERGVQRAISISNALDQKLDEKREAARADVMQYNRKNNRAQFNKLYDLVSRHDMRPNK